MVRLMLMASSLRWASRLESRRTKPGTVEWKRKMAVRASSCPEWPPNQSRLVRARLADAAGEKGEVGAICLQEG